MSTVESHEMISSSAHNLLNLLIEIPKLARMRLNSTFHRTKALILRTNLEAMPRIIINIRFTNRCRPRRALGLSICESMVTRLQKQQRLSKMKRPKLAAYTNSRANWITRRNYWGLSQWFKSWMALTRTDYVAARATVGRMYHLGTSSRRASAKKQLNHTQPHQVREAPTSIQISPVTTTTRKVKVRCLDASNSINFRLKRIASRSSRNLVRRPLLITTVLTTMWRFTSMWTPIAPHASSHGRRPSPTIIQSPRRHAWSRSQVVKQLYWIVIV